MHCSGFFSLLALPGVLAVPWYTSPDKRAASATAATLYAYGTSISGHPVLYDEATGDLYISAANTTMGGLQSLTWNIPAVAAASKSTATAALTNGTSVGGLSLNGTNAGVSPVTIAATGTAGVAVYGQQLVYVSGSTFESKFWGKSVTFDGAAAYTVTWNTDNTLEDGMIPLSLKTLGPATVST